MEEKNKKRTKIPEFYILNSYTDTDYRDKGINECIKLILYRLRPEPKIETEVYSEEGEYLKRNYENLKKEIKMEVNIERKKYAEYKKYRNYEITLLKNKNTNILIERKLKKKYKTDF